MEINIDDINFEALREDLINYFGTASSFYPVAFMDVISVQNATDLELLEIINRTNLDINDYLTNNLSK